MAQAICLKVIAGHQQYWKETVPAYVDYYPGDVFRCGANEAHQWQTFEPWRNLVSFTPALIPRPDPDWEPSGCSITPDLPC